MFGNDTLTTIIFLIVGLIILLFIVKIIFSFVEFGRDLRYINMEINRTDGRERRHWKRKRRELIIDLLLFRY